MLKWSGRWEIKTDREITENQTAGTEKQEISTNIYLIITNMLKLKNFGRELGNAK